MPHAVPIIPPEPIPDSYLLTFPQAVRLTGVSETTLRRAVRDGKLTTHRVGKYLRIRHADLASYIASLRQPR